MSLYTDFTEYEVLRHKVHWNKIFFDKYDNMSFSYSDVSEFWTFFQKYFTAKRQRPQNERNDEKLVQTLIQKYSHEWPVEWVDENFLRKKSKEVELARNFSRYNLIQLRNVVFMFVDFYTKRREKKMEKMRKFQQNLPIYKEKDQIIQTIQDYSVILIAGDTGEFMECCNSAS